MMSHRSWDSVGMIVQEIILDDILLVPTWLSDLSFLKSISHNFNK